MYIVCLNVRVTLSPLSPTSPLSPPPLSPPLPSLPPFPSLPPPPSQDLCDIEEELETKLGVFHVRIMGLAGLGHGGSGGGKEGGKGGGSMSSGMGGDSYEVQLKLSSQKWKARCRIIRGQQAWQDEDVSFPPSCSLSLSLYPSLLSLSSHPSPPSYSHSHFHLLTLTFISLSFAASHSICTQYILTPSYLTPYNHEDTYTVYTCTCMCVHIYIVRVLYGIVTMYM